MSLINVFHLGTRTPATISRRFLSATVSLRASNQGGSQSASGVQHTSDTYAKDVDTSPASDQQVYRLDALSENVQKPYEAPSGEWSRIGITAAEYATMNKSDQPYAPKDEGEPKQRYGGTKSWVNDKGPETSHSGQGPAGSDAGGRKPER
ncbi:hypothetical protein AN958_05427 [Leucoagaricus sp. SymC.cos]|nr:hypothetical protein AN958_05427 [Leucoagaricus sp. SymC.cos]